MLFHGTLATLQPGDIIEPRSKNVAHATELVVTARVFGGNVYAVEPVDPEVTWRRQMKHTGDEVHHEVLSEAGFRVVELLPPDRTDAYWDTRTISSSMVSISRTPVLIPWPPQRYPSYPQGHRAR